MIQTLKKQCVNILSDVQKIPLCLDQNCYEIFRLFY